MKKCFTCWKCEKHFDNDQKSNIWHTCKECYQGIDDYLKGIFYKDNLIDKEKMSKGHNPVIEELERIRSDYNKKINDVISKINKKVVKEQEWVENGYFIPEDDEVTYYPSFIDDYMTTTEIYSNSNIFGLILSAGLSFKTEEAAEKKGRQMIARRKLVEAIRKYNDGWVPDFKNLEPKFTFCFENGDLKILSCLSRQNYPIELVVKDDIREGLEEKLSITEEEAILAIWGIENE